MIYDSIEQYLPHCAPMIMLDEVISVDDEQCVCRIQVDDASALGPFLNSDSTLDNYYLMEIMAQTVGVWNGYHGNKMGEKCKLGMLLGGRSIAFSRGTYAKGTILNSYGKLIFLDDKLATFQCEIKIEDETISSGRITVYKPNEEELDELFKREHLKDAL